MSQKTTAVASTRSTGSRIAGFVRRPEFGALIGALAVYLFFAAAGGAPFLAPGGSASWLNVAAELGIIALAVALVMIAGDLDLSVGSVLAGSSMVLSISSGYYGLPTIVGIILAIGFGVTVGVINGILVTRTNLPSFVVTLATNFAVVGLTLGFTRLLVGSTAVSFQADEWAKLLFGTLIDGKFETAIIWWIVVALAVGWVLYQSPWGNWIYAIGGDVVSARAAGIPVEKVRIALFAGSGFAAAFVGVIQTSLYNGSQVAMGQSFVFNSIIAVVVGGVLLTGGYGSPIGVILGTLTFAIVNQGIYYTGWNADWASLILGILLLIAVLANNSFRRMALTGGATKASSKSKES